MTLSDNSDKTVTTLPNQVQKDPPVKTFLRSEFAEKRIEWFTNHKKAALSRRGYPNLTDQFTNTPVQHFLNIINTISNNSGINVHFAAKRKDRAELLLLFVSADKNLKDTGDYYQLNPDGTFVKVANSDEAKRLIDNYKNGVKTQLDGTTPKHGETEYVHFEKETIDEIKGEIDYQAKKKRVAGITTKVVSFADSKTEEQITRDEKPKFLQRLTVLFTYVDDQGNETDFKTIDPHRHAKTIYIQDHGAVGGYDTGMPVPPYPGQD